MDDENLSTAELLEKRKKEMLIALGKLKDDDPNRQKMVAEIKAYSEIQNADETLEQSRVNNNAKNELEEQRLVIDEMKAKNEARRIKVDIGKICAAVIIGFGGNLMSYNMDTVQNAYKECKLWAQKQYDKLLNK